ncbi:Clp protease N-terminal domain-containing protein [Streptacidiphilus sp. P02-A3a]|uniref:Clp protease N-terminal domain-containing protein n=1 Tax=Streptacidiphilus sp. P02-A3a TaxID=2704468 RepID=UPI0015F7BF5F|nr:Clp protease N-terminal domain-containing protein [Streptacidiphilus sp. P02-A3a]QMU69425.1 ATP-dependent Clp protease ATP-binding subunit [Streptacidiphilus sp. P02-A3a]
MPKINVYLPDDLAEAVKEAGVPVSAVCQQALEQAVRRVTALRASSPDELAREDPSGRLAYFTARSRDAVRRAVELAAAEGGGVGTRHLLGGVLDQEGNLALRVLQVLEIDPAGIRRALEREPDADAGESGRFSATAANALELTASEALALGHNYVGCEHLLLGLIAEPEGAAGRVLRALGVEHRAARRAVSAALVGYAHLRAQSTAAPEAAPNAGALKAVGELVAAQLRPVVERLERLEARLDSAR